MFPSFPQTHSIFQGAKLELSDESRVVFRVCCPPGAIDHAGRIPSSALFALAESVASYSMERNLPDGARLEPLSADANFLPGPHAQELLVEAVLLQLGSAIAKWEVTVRCVGGRAVLVVTDTRLIDRDAYEQEAAIPSTEQSPAAHESTSLVEPASVSVDPGAPEPGPLNTQATSTSDLRRGQILRAAFEVISEKGFASASMRQIAQKAGMSVPAVYQYVRSKDELLEEIFAGYIKRMEHAVQDSTFQNSSASEQLRSAIAASMAEFDRYQAEIRVMNRESKALRREVRQRIKFFLCSYIERFRRIIASGVESGEFRKVEASLYANFIPMLCDVWPLRNWAVRPYGVEQVRDSIIDLLLHALEPAPDSSRRLV